MQNNKRHVKNFKSFVNENLKMDGNLDDVNEGLFSWIKDKVTMAISKKIGGASKIDAQTKVYMAKMMGILDKKIALEKDLTDSKKAFDENPKDVNLQKAYELKQKSHEGQMKAVNTQENALKNLYNLNLKKIIGTNNPMLAQYSDMIKTENELALSEHAEESYKSLGEASELYVKASQEVEKLRKDAKQKQDALSAAAKMNKDNESESSDVIPENIKVGVKFNYKNKAGKDVVVQVANLMKNDKIESQNGKMVIVKSLNRLSEKDYTGFKVRKADLKPIKSDKEPAKKVDGDVVTSNDTVKGEKEAETV